MVNVYSTHQITDGRWQVTIWIREEPGYKFNPGHRPDLRQLIDAHYNETPETLGRTILDNTLHAERVHVQTLCGKGVYVEVPQE